METTASRRARREDVRTCTRLHRSARRRREARPTSAARGHRRTRPRNPSGSPSTRRPGSRHRCAGWTSRSGRARSAIRNRRPQCASVPWTAMRSIAGVSESKFPPVKRYELSVMRRFRRSARVAPRQVPPNAGIPIKATTRSATGASALRCTNSSGSSRRRHRFFLAGLVTATLHCSRRTLPK